MSEMEVAERRQAINDDAYFQALKALVAKGHSDLSLSWKLRKQLNVSNNQHKAWYEELRGAMAHGPAALEAARGPSASMPQHQLQHLAPQASGGGGGRKRQPGGGGQRAGAGGQQQGQVVLQRAASRSKGSKASQQTGAYSAAHQQQQYQQQQVHTQPASSDESRMVGYKVSYKFEGNQWMEGVITDYQPPNIIITFNLNSPSEFSRSVKWEQSDSLQMRNEMVNLTEWNQQRRAWPPHGH